MGNERSADAVISVVPHTREGVELLRQRLAVFWGAVLVVCVVALVPTHVLSALSLGRQVNAGLTHPGTVAQLASLIAVGVIWFWCRFRQPSQRALEMLDAAAVLAFCSGGAAMTYFAPGALLPALDTGGPASPNLSGGLLAVVVISTMRAALVPSTPQRTAVVSALACLPLVVASGLLTGDAPSPAERTSFLTTIMISVFFTPLPTVISAVIYRLQRQVEEARQLGQYTLEAKIGEGGMGVVYRARHALLRRPTAIKLLPPERAGTEALARFQREVLQTSRLSHPNTVAIYDFGTTASGIFYYAMEYLDGVSLQELVEQDGPQPPGRVAHLLIQACGALSEAHAAGLIHRDIKPANLHLSNRGGVADHLKVLDFGLVKDLAATGVNAEPSLTSAGSLLGTPLYLAPEAISAPDGVDARADVYALGAVAYFLLTGAAPFGGNSLVEICGKHLHVEPEPPSKWVEREIPAALEALVLSCLAKAPAGRPASARELARSLRDAAGGWSHDDAERWWEQRGPSVLERSVKRRKTEARGSGNDTLALDLESRVPAQE
jgi:eukaryotic-like serine/threonine-protein kinase